MYRLIQLENWWGHRKRLFWIADHIKDNSVCLDVGCGTGAYLTIPLNILMQERGIKSKIYGMDLAKESIEVAKKNAKIMNLPSDIFFCGDITKHEKKYDIVICSEVLEHISDIYLDEFVDSLCEKVSEDGTLIITVPNGNGSFEKGKRMRKSFFGKTLFVAIEKIATIFNYDFLHKFMYFDMSNLKTKEDKILAEMTVSMTEHIQFFCKNDIVKLFEKRDMKLVEFSGAARFSGAWICLLPPFQFITQINNSLGDKEPLNASGYYFVFKKEKNEC